MTTFQKSMLVAELRDITRTNVLRTNEEARATRQRAAEICREFGCEFPEDVFERFGP